MKPGTVLLGLGRCPPVNRWMRLWMASMLKKVQLGLLEGVAKQSHAYSECQANMSIVRQGQLAYPTCKAPEQVVDGWQSFTWTRAAVEQGREKDREGARRDFSGPIAHLSRH